MYKVGIAAAVFFYLQRKQRSYYFSNFSPGLPGAIFLILLPKLNIKDYSPPSVNGCNRQNSMRLLHTAVNWFFSVSAWPVCFCTGVTLWGVERMPDCSIW
jgi:hypothetical protein